MLILHQGYSFFLNCNQHNTHFSKYQIHFLNLNWNWPHVSQKILISWCLPLKGNFRIILRRYLILNWGQLVMLYMVSILDCIRYHGSESQHDMLYPSFIVSLEVGVYLFHYFSKLSPMQLTGLPVSTQLTMTLNSWSSCLHPPSAKITCMHHHTQFYADAVLRVKLRTS